MKVLLAVALLAMPFQAAAETLVGPASVVDGDTIEIDGRRIRLFGIDAPELSQSCDRDGEPWACGAASADRLRALVGDYEVSCAGDEVDIYTRLLAVCMLSGVDLNRTMVADGWATAFRRYSGSYVADETRARASRLGLWSSNFMAPEDVRRQEDAPASTRAAPSRAPARQSQPAAGQCLIKGNRGRNGWIYHLPGRPYYAETRAEEMFCTEAEAQAAGYRRSKA